MHSPRPAPRASAVRRGSALLRHPPLAFWVAALVVLGAVAVGVWRSSDGGSLDGPPPQPTPAEVAAWRSDVSAVVRPANPGLVDPAATAAAAEALAVRADPFAADPRWAQAASAARQLAAAPSSPAAHSQLSLAADRLSPLPPPSPGT